MRNGLGQFVKIAPASTKRCKTCGEEKPVDRFYRTAGKDCSYRAASCKACMAEADKAKRFSRVRGYRAQNVKGVPLWMRLINRFVVAENGCWNWTGAVGGHGYGELHYKGRPITAPRAMMMEFRGAMFRPGDYVCHRCDNRLCVNPEHLYVGDVKTNHADMVRRGRASPGGRRVAA